MFDAEQILSEIFSTLPGEDDRMILFNSQEVLLKNTDGKYLLPQIKDVAGVFSESPRFFYLGKSCGERCFAAFAELPEPGTPDEDIEKYTCRRILPELDENLQTALCRGRKLVRWAASHRFCGVCRNELVPSDNDLALTCPVCKESYYPQIAPAVIVAVTRDNGRELLLAHNRNFAGGFYSLIAGFVEAGECVEDAVRREIMEECGIKVRNIRYFTSQAWPFPNSLMLAFTAEYDSGTAVPDGMELTDLGWFTADSHPQLPLRGSVARKVIDYLWGEVR